MDFSTICVHGKKKHIDATGAVIEPIYQSATFAHPGVGESTGYDYSRLQNPTRFIIEEKLAAMEEGIDCIAFSTGMAAISCLMELFCPGDHFIVSDDLYGGTSRLFDFISKKNGLRFDCVNTSFIEEIAKCICSNTKAIFIETPTNPMMQVTDIRAVSELAKKHNCLLIVDNTFLTPYFQKPLLLGADIVVHSGTKFLCGHNDTLCGFLVIRDAEISEKIRFLSLGDLLNILNELSNSLHFIFISYLFIFCFSSMSLNLVERYIDIAVVIKHRIIGIYPFIAKTKPEIIEVIPSK